MHTAPFNDVREYLELVNKMEGYKVIDGADWDLEIGAITELYLSTANPPLLLFDHIKGYNPGYRILSNITITPRRTALALGLPLDTGKIGLVKAWRERTKGIKPIRPIEVKSGPVKENILIGEDVDLFKFPVPRWNELDGGRYIGTADVVIMKDPDENWVNCGTYRIQIHDRNTATIYMMEGKHGDIIRRKYWEKGLACPVAASVGQNPLLWCISSTFFPWQVPEYDYVGGLRNAPLEVVRGETTDLPIPAAAEIVLEGEMLPPGKEDRLEGPFAEWTGYYASGSRKEPAFKVKSILHRDNPIITGIVHKGGPESLDLDIRRSARVWDEIERQVPNVKGVWMHLANVPAMITVISIKQSYLGHAKHTLLAASGSPHAAHMSKFIIVVDDDIDPSNVNEVLWAVSSRCDPQESIDVVRKCWSNELDPRVPPGSRDIGDCSHSKALIDACKPFNWISKFPASVKGSSALLDNVNRKWKIIQ